MIASTTASHVGAIDELLSRRIPIYCEKPLCTDAGIAARVVADGGSQLLVIDKWRYHPGVIELARIRCSEELGPTRALHTTRVGTEHSQDDINIAWTLLPHELAIARGVLGRLPTSEKANATVAAGRVQSLHVKSGGRIEHRSHVAANGSHRCRRIELVCAGGTAVVDDDEPDVVRLCRSGVDGHVERDERRRVDRRPPLESALRAFVDHLAGGPPPMSSGPEGLAVVEEITRALHLAGVDPVHR